MAMIAHSLRRVMNRRIETALTVPTAEQARLLNAADALFSTLMLCDDPNYKVREAYDDVVLRISNTLSDGVFLAMTPVKEK